MEEAPNWETPLLGTPAAYEYGTEVKRQAPQALAPLIQGSGSRELSGARRTQPSIQR
jgi:hypothetical protein